MLVVAPFVGAGCDKQLWHLVLVAVALDRRVGWRAQRVEQEGHLVLLNQASDQLDRLGRAEAVIEGDEIDPAPADAALAIQPGEIRRFGLADWRIGRERAAIWHGVADLDLSGGDARRIGGSCSQTDHHW